MARSLPSAALLAAGLAVSIAQAQVNTLAWTTDDDDPFGFFNTDAGVGVNAEAVVSTGNMRVALFDRLGNELDSRQVGDSDWPFLRIDNSIASDPGKDNFASRYFDPQVEYHTQSGRLWMIYSETNCERPSATPIQVFGSGDNDLSALHIAISREMVGLNELDTLDYEDWWYYTGDGSTNVGQAGDYFDLQDVFMQEYRPSAGVPGEPGHVPYPSGGGFFSPAKVDKPQISIDEQAAYVLSLGGLSIGTTMAIIPTSHGVGGSLSILEGEKPPASTWTFVRLNQLGVADGVADNGVDDNHNYHYAVQEPFEETEFENRQFVLSIPSTPTGSPGTDIRVGCMWFDVANSRWQYAQRTKTGTGSPPVELDDPAVGNGFEYFQQPFGEPSTPDAGGWGPTVPRALIQGVLVKDANNEPRIFAIHHAAAVDDLQNPLGPQNQFVVQWYVIDPKLADVVSTSVGGWQPDIVAKGRLDAGTGDRYHPVIGVTQQGVAYIEYTYSDATTWPEVRRATLNSSYTDIVPNSVQTIRTGPAHIYDTDQSSWADFAEMQADPVTPCSFWSVHTLVSPVPEGIERRDKRDVWLFQSVFNCGNSNLNFDDGTDLYDMAMFNSLYGAGARRVDMNTDGTTDAADAILYQDAYDAATGP